MVNSMVTTGPTKDFFISMITRDISLSDAIIELLDNSLDAAKKLRDNNNFDGLKIEITFSKDYFTIKDNCGGIPLVDAKNYVFYFGRPKNVPKSDKEVTGVFGIGLKRALFKIGKEFVITSITNNTKFSLNLDVIDWSTKEGWDFPIEEEEGEQNPNEIGTEITVRNLYEGIAADFSSGVFENGLMNKIQQRASFEIENNINITVNTVPITPDYLKIIYCDEIKPIKKTIPFQDVNVVVVAGMANETDKDDAGWYIYCNNRLIISADKTSLTTWNDKDTVKFHSDFAAFRGFVFFNSKDPEKLPWNTSKTSIDTSSNVYISTRLIMIDVFKIVTNELRNMKKLDAEQEGSIEEELKGKASVAINIGTINKNIAENNLFSISEKVKFTQNPNPFQRISYFKLKKDIEIVKKALGVKSRKEVGEITFDYFMDMECE